MLRYALRELFEHTLKTIANESSRASDSDCGFKFGIGATNPKLVSAWSPQEVPTSPNPGFGFFRLLYESSFLILRGFKLMGIYP